MLTFVLLVLFVLIFLLFALIGESPAPQGGESTAPFNRTDVQSDAMLGHGVGLHTGLGLPDPFEAQRHDEELQRSHDFTELNSLTHSELLSPHIGMGMGIDHADSSMFSDTTHLGGNDSSYHSMN